MYAFALALLLEESYQGRYRYYRSMLEAPVRVSWFYSFLLVHE